MEAGNHFKSEIAPRQKEMFHYARVSRYKHTVGGAPHALFVTPRHRLPSSPDAAPGDAAESIDAAAPRHAAEKRLCARFLIRHGNRVEKREKIFKEAMDEWSSLSLSLCPCKGIAVDGIRRKKDENLR